MFCGIVRDGCFWEIQAMNNAAALRGIAPDFNRFLHHVSIQLPGGAMFQVPKSALSSEGGNYRLNERPQVMHVFPRREYLPPADMASEETAVTGCLVLVSADIAEEVYSKAKEYPLGA